MRLATTLRTSLLGFALSASLASPGVAVTWTEIGDANELASNAQTTLGSGPLSSISGTLDTMGDRDLYCIRITNRAAFEAWLTCAAIGDPDLFLIEPNGLGVAANNHCAGAKTNVTGLFVPANGAYRIGVAWNGASANSGIGQPIWNTAATPGERSPDGPGAPGPLVSWGAMPSIPTALPYTIQLTGCEPCDAAVPASTRSWGAVKLHYR